MNNNNKLSEKSQNHIWKALFELLQVFKEIDLEEEKEDFTLLFPFFISFYTLMV